tara:strand:+ start:32228 stop:33691 length:1464 start_codon:yes stop_codon:yes gene_type:complete
LVNILKKSYFLLIFILSSCGGGGGSTSSSGNIITPATDTTPSTFNFTDQNDVRRDQVITSNSITVVGINTATNISITGGTYSIAGGAYIASAGTVTNGQTITVRHTSSSSLETITNTILTIGGVGDTFSSTTRDRPIELVHDPSQFFVTGIPKKVYGYASGQNSDAINTYELIFSGLTLGTVSKKISIGADALAQSWWTSIQTWNATGEFDAPSITKNGEFIFFTAYDEHETLGVKDAIGFAENVGSIGAPNWLDEGIILQSVGEGPETPRTMDPSIFEDGTNFYLIFGSHAGGIYIADLNDGTKKLANSPNLTSTNQESSRFTKIANNLGENDPNPQNKLTGIEAAYLHKNGSFYYLFVNFGSCCSDLDSTYKVKVGRSSTITGPYLDKNGVSMIDGGGSDFDLSRGESRIIGPGHVGITDINGVTINNWIQDKITAFGGSTEIVTFHYYDGSQNGNSKLGANLLKWEDGWPVTGDLVVDTPNSFD